MTQCRWLDADDLAPWRDLRGEALRLQPEAFLTTLAEFQAQADDAVRARLAEGRTLGLWDGDRLVGSCGYLRKANETTAHRAELAAVYLRTQYRGSGAGAAMMGAIEARAAREGVVQLELWVWEGNARAIAYYERHGFARMGRMPRAVMVEGEGRDDLFYVRALDQ